MLSVSVGFEDEGKKEKSAAGASSRSCLGLAWETGRLRLAVTAL